MLVKENQQISVKQVSESKRLSILPKYAGRHMMRVESHILDAMRAYCESYQGGYWYMYELSNGGFYMAPGRDETLSIRCAGNFYEGSMSADAAGLVATLAGINRVVWLTESKELTALYYAVREFAFQHKESQEILRAID